MPDSTQPSLLSDSAGRSCPASYRMDPAGLIDAPEIQAECVWIIGGLYGNLPALLAVKKLIALDAAAGLHVQAVFNGDFHWFDRQKSLFDLIQNEVARHHATAGNVEVQLADPNDDVGCGCAYPPDVADDFVMRSNHIHAQLQQVCDPQSAAALASLPRAMRASVAGQQIGIVHGDPESLAGWLLSWENRKAHPAELVKQVAAWAEAGGVNAFACTHTCLPWAARLDDIAVINNGAAGMPNFTGTRIGIVTRIASAAHPHADAIVRLPAGDAIIEAIALHYDHQGWLGIFDMLWPAGSEACVSYRERIQAGPAHSLQAAYGEAVLK